MKSKFLILSFLLSYCSLAFSQNFQTQSVSIFKNGQSFFIKKGKVQPESGTWKMGKKDTPPALFGSLWFNAPEKKIQSVKSYPDTTIAQKSEQASAVLDLLYINKGKKMTLLLTDDSILQGEVVELTDTKTQKDQYGRVINNLAALVFKTNAGWVTLNPTYIKQITFSEKPDFTLKTEEKKMGNVVEIQFASQKQEQDLEMMYLRNGLSWSPQYLLELQSTTKANLILQSEIANDGENLSDVDLNLVVGVPNFKYAKDVAYLVDFLRNEALLTSRQDIHPASNTFSQSISYAINADFQGNTGSSTPQNPVEGTTNEDLFFYTLNDFSLPKGGRAMQQLFKESIDIQHIYECNLNQNSLTNYRTDFLFTPDTDNPVVHSVKIINSTNQPWTTGAVFVVNKEGKTSPLSQDMLTYTPSKGHSFIKLTEAPDVKVEQAEKEVSRQERAKQSSSNKNTWYDLVKIEGQIKAKNYKNKNIDLNIRRPIIGILGKSSEKWLKAERVNRDFNINTTTDVCWETTVEAGKELIIQYDYEIYIRHF